MRTHLGLFLALFLFPQIASAQATQFYLEDEIAPGLKARIYVIADRHARTQVQAGLYQAVDRARELLIQTNPYSPYSDLGRINTAKQKGTYPVKPAVAEAVAKALEAAKATDGAFDILENPPRGADYRKISANPRSGTIRLREDGLTLSLKAIEQGILADLVAEVLAKEGWKDCLVKVGTAFATLGSDVGGPWKIPIMTPTTGLATRMLFYKATGTVGAASYPAGTAAPLAGDLQSATVIGQSATKAHATAIALYNLGEAKARQFLSRHRGLRGVLVTSAGEYRHIPDWQSNASTLEEENVAPKTVWTPAKEPPVGKSKPVKMRRAKKPAATSPSSTHSNADTL